MPQDCLLCLFTGYVTFITFWMQKKKRFYSDSSLIVFQKTVSLILPYQRHYFDQVTPNANLKVSKFQKQFLLFSFHPKLYCIKCPLINAIEAFFDPFKILRAEIKKIISFGFGGNEDKKICFWNLLTFNISKIYVIIPKKLPKLKKKKLLSSYATF